MIKQMFIKRTVTNNNSRNRHFVMVLTMHLARCKHTQQNGSTHRFGRHNVGGASDIHSNIFSCRIERSITRTLIETK